MKLGELDLHLAGEGRHERIYERLGAHVTDEGVSFAVWAPNARGVAVVGQMPSTGLPMAKSAGSQWGAPASDTLFGPPDRIIPAGERAAILSAGVSGGQISEYTESSRRRRAMTCVYCDPQSRTMIV